MELPTNNLFASVFVSSHICIHARTNVDRVFELRKEVLYKELNIKYDRESLLTT